MTDLETKPTEDDLKKALHEYLGPLREALEGRTAVYLRGEDLVVFDMALMKKLTQGNLLLKALVEWNTVAHEVARAEGASEGNGLEERDREFLDTLFNLLKDAIGKTKP